MTGITRLFSIIQVFLRFRLDTLFNGQALPWSARIILSPLKLLPAPTQSRGIRSRRAMEELGPIFVKFGQLLSTRPDLIPDDICSELSKLQDKVPPFNTEQFIQCVESALNSDIDSLFKSFDTTPLASASVAQVHTAVLPDNREVVVKVIRPGIAKTINQDCNLLLNIAKLIEKYSPDGKRLRSVEVANDYRNTVIDELNLQREAANTTTLRRNFDNSPLLYVPEIYWPYCNERVMVVERVYATPVTDIAELEKNNVNFKVLAERGVEIFFTQVFDHNFFHADMHPGNIFVDTQDPEAPRYLAIDCAIIGSLSDRDRYFLARNLLAVFRRDYRQVAELHALAGWVGESASLIEVEAAIRTVCEPIFQQPLKDISFGQLLVSLFQAARRFDAEVQPSLVLLQKTLLNVEGLGRQLYPDLDLWATAHPFLENWLVTHFGPSNIFRRISRDGPEWIEQLPELPQLAFRALEQLEKLEQTLGKTPTTVVEGRPPVRIRFKVLGALVVGTGLGSMLGASSASGGDITALTMALIMTGLILLLCN
jgi:ubiquinone biosynthesis protein